MRSILRNKSTEVLLFCGLAAMIAVSLENVMPVRCGQMVFFMILAGLMGRRVRLVPPAVMLLSVVIANLFSPNGRVLFSVWRFDVTYGALRLGLLKGSLLVGLIYVSRVSVGPGLKVPGYFGALLLKAFAYFEVLTEKWPGTRGGLLKRIDILLEEASGVAAGPAGGEVEGTAPGSTEDFTEAVAVNSEADRAAEGVAASGSADLAAQSAAARSHRLPQRSPQKNLMAAAVLVIAGWGPYIATAVIV